MKPYLPELFVFSYGFAKNLQRNVVFNKHANKEVITITSKTKLNIFQYNCNANYSIRRTLG